LQYISNLFTLKVSHATALHSYKCVMQFVSNSIVSRQHFVPELITT